MNAPHRKAALPTPLLLAALGACANDPAADPAADPAPAGSVVSSVNLNGDGLSAPLEVPLVVTLHNSTTGNGQSRHLLRDVPDLTRMAFGDAAVRLYVQAGPSYAAWKARNGGVEPSVTFWLNTNYGGTALRVYAGNIVDSAALTAVGLNARISSVRFNDDAYTPNVRPVAAQIGASGNIDLVAVLYTGTGFSGSYVMHVVESTNFGVGYGSTFNGTVSSVQLLRGPNYTGTKLLELCRGLGYVGGCVRLTYDGTNDNVEGASITNLGSWHDFDNAARSARLRRTCF